MGSSVFPSDVHVHGSLAPKHGAGAASGTALAYRVGSVAGNDVPWSYYQRVKFRVTNHLCWLAERTLGHPTFGLAARRQYLSPPTGESSAPRPPTREVSGEVDQSHHDRYALECAILRMPASASTLGVTETGERRSRTRTYDRSPALRLLLLSCIHPTPEGSLRAFLGPAEHVALLTFGSTGCDPCPFWQCRHSPRSATAFFSAAQFS
jgi:hypothetical protein